jgi:hypothetical protein
VWNPTLNTLSLASPGNAFSQTGTDSSSSGQTFSVSTSSTGLVANSAYASFACYSNGFGKVVVDAPRIATLEDPTEGQFTYRVSSTANANGEWLVELASSPDTSGLVVQYNGRDRNNPADWRNQIYSSKYGEENLIYVRYCLTDLTSCSPGNTRVTSTSNAWQMRVAQGFLTDSAGTPTQQCQSGVNLFFHVSGDGVGTFANPNYQIQRASGFVPQFTSDGVTWQNMQSSGLRWRIPSGVPATQIRFNVTGNPLFAPTAGMSTPYQIPAFNVNCQ